MYCQVLTTLSLKLVHPSLCSHVRVLHDPIESEQEPFSLSIRCAVQCSCHFANRPTTMFSRKQASGFERGRSVVSRHLPCS